MNEEMGPTGMKKIIGGPIGMKKIGGPTRMKK